MHKKTCQKLRDFCRSQNIETYSSHFKRSSGGETCYSAFLPRSFDRLVLFAHGTGNDALYPHHFFFEQLLNANVGVFSFDLDGHGSNSTTSLNQDHFFSQIKDVKTTLEERQLLHLPIVFVGYSLGGLLAWSKDIPFESRHLIGTPFLLEANSASLMNELSILRNIDFLSQVKHLHPLELIPAVGPFRRASFPIRMRRSDRRSMLGFSESFSYVGLVKRLFELQAHQLDRADPSIATQFIYGQLDSIAPPASYNRFHKKMLKHSFEDIECIVELDTSHLGLLYSVKVAEQILRFNHAAR